MTTFPAYIYLENGDIFEGQGFGMEKFEVAHISYMNDEYGELSNHSLEGKSKEWFLIDDQGEVISL